MMFATMVSMLPQVRNGKVRALGVTGARRGAEVSTSTPGELGRYTREEMMQRWALVIKQSGARAD